MDIVSELAYIQFAAKISSFNSWSKVKIFVFWFLRKRLIHFSLLWDDVPCTIEPRTGLMLVEHLKSFALGLLSCLYLFPIKFWGTLFWQSLPFAFGVVSLFVIQFEFLLACDSPGEDVLHLISQLVGGNPNGNDSYNGFP